MQLQEVSAQVSLRSPRSLTREETFSPYLRITPFRDSFERYNSIYE